MIPRPLHHSTKAEHSTSHGERTRRRGAIAASAAYSASERRTVAAKGITRRERGGERDLDVLSHIPRAAAQTRLFLCAGLRALVRVPADFGCRCHRKSLFSSAKPTLYMAVDGCLTAVMKTLWFTNNLLKALHSRAAGWHCCRPW